MINRTNRTPSFNEAFSRAALPRRTEAQRLQPHRSRRVLLGTASPLACSLAVLGCLLGTTSIAFADWPNIGGSVGQIWEQHVKPPAQQATRAVEATAKAATAPIVATANLVTGRQNLPDAATDAMRAQGKAISETSNALGAGVNGATGITVGTAKELTNAAGGNGDTVGGAVSTFLAPASITASAATQGGNAVGLVSQNGGDLSYLASAPLAAALADAHARFQGLSRPLPDDVRAKLALVHSPETLARARYVIADAVPNTLASLIDRGQTTVNGGGFAVTIDDIIVFSRLPGKAPSELHWWAHEVQHTVQYRQLGGIADFANAYMKNAPALEHDADAKGDQLVQVLASAN